MEYELAAQVSALKGADIVPPETSAMLTTAELSAVANERLAKPVALEDAPVLELSARHPHDPAGEMEVFMALRWDSSDNYVSIARSFQSAGYVRVSQPASGTYLVAVHFFGHDTTLRVSGPWGSSTGHSATTADNAVVTALWESDGSVDLNFTFDCVGDESMANVRSVQLHKL